MRTTDVDSSRAVQAVYEAVADRRLWQTVAKEMAALLKGHQAIILLSMTESGVAEDSVVTYGISAEIRQRYIELLSEDPWLEGMLQLQPNMACYSEQFIPLTTLKRQRFYHELCAPADVAHMIGGVAVKSHAGTTLFATQCSSSLGPFSPQQLSEVEQLLPHFARAAYVQETIGTLQQEVQSLRSTLNQLRVATLLFDENARLCWANTAAESLLREHDGLTVHMDRLAADRLEETERLNHCIQEASNTTRESGISAGGRMQIIRPSARLPYQVSVCPLDRPGGAWGYRATAAVFVVDPEHPPRMSPESFRHFYGLTAAESRLCELLLGGLSLHQAADASSIGISTARTHLKSIFRKCRVTSQSQLMLRLVQSLEVVGS